MKIKIKDVFEKDEKDIHVQTNERLDIDEIFEDAREERQEMSLEEEKNDATGISDMSVQDSSEEPAVNAGVVEASDDAEQVEPSQDAAEAGPEEVTAAEAVSFRNAKQRDENRHAVLCYTLLLVRFSASSVKKARSSNKSSA